MPGLVHDEQAHGQAVHAAAPAADRCGDKAASSSIRVAADKLDALVDLVGELVIVQAQIRQAVEERGDAHMPLGAIAHEVVRACAS